MDFLKILEDFVNEVAGKDAVKLLNLMKERENISEFELAEDLKLNVNQVRNLLYKLNSFNLVYSSRKKDREKGWYIYYWTFNFRHARDVLTARKKLRLNILQEELDKESKKGFYVCPNNDVRMDLEEALEHNFKCPECGALLKQEDSSKKISEIQHEITKLTHELEELSKPLMIAPAREEEIEKKKKPRKVKKKKVKKKIRKIRKVKKAKKVKKKKIKKAKKKIKKTKRSKKTKKAKSKKKSSKFLKKLKKFRF